MVVRREMIEDTAAGFLDTFRSFPRSSALFLDFDGTLSEIAPTPEGARLHPQAHHEVTRLAGIHPLCIISGRPVAELARLVPLAGISLVGLHGLEWREGEAYERLPEAQPSLEVMRSARGFLLASGLFSRPGVRLEDKELILALHFRQAPEDEAEVEALAKETAERYRLALHRGRQVIEVRPPLVFNKGRAVEMMVRRHAFAQAAYLGDDLTDVAAFRALHELEGEGFSGLAVAVVSPESPPELLQECDLEVEGVAGVVVFLGSL
jgi:trehalose 6-phosphate phosphatase